MPKEHIDKFEMAGINLHDPRLTVPLPRKLHQQVHKAGYNSDWNRFLREKEYQKISNKEQKNSLMSMVFKNT